MLHPSRSIAQLQCSLLEIRSTFILGAAQVRWGLEDATNASTTFTSLVNDKPVICQVLSLSSSSISPCGARIRGSDIIGEWTAWCQVTLLFALCLILSYAWWILKKFLSEGMSCSISGKFFLFSSGPCLTWLPSLPTFQAQICLYNCASSLREHPVPEN